MDFYFLMIKKLKYFFDFDVFCLNFSFVNMVYNIVCNKLVCIFFWKNFGILFWKRIIIDIDGSCWNRNLD